MKFKKIGKTPTPIEQNYLEEAIQNGGIIRLINIASIIQSLINNFYLHGHVCVGGIFLS